MMLAAVDTIPLMMVVRRLPVDVASELLIMDVEDDTPLTVEVRVLVEERRELVVGLATVVVDPSDIVYVVEVELLTIPVIPIPVVPVAPCIPGVPVAPCSPAGPWGPVAPVVDTGTY